MPDGLSPGFVPVYDRSGRFLVAAQCADALELARPFLLQQTQQTSQASAAIAFEAGAMLCNGERAAARRAALGLMEESWTEEHGRPNAAALALLASTALWLAGVDGSAFYRVVASIDRAAAERASSAAVLRGYAQYAQAREALAQPSGEQTGATAWSDGLPAGSSVDVSRAALGSASCEAPGREVGVSVLLHTCDAYSQFWEGWSHHFARHWPDALCWPVHFAHEEADVGAILARVHGQGHQAVAAPTGRGEFSTRYLRALRVLQTPLVLYMQEDMWLTRSARRMTDSLRCASELVAAGTFDGIRFESPNMIVSGGYHLLETAHRCDGRTVFRFAAHNRWLFSHQPGVWRRELLLGRQHDAQGRGSGAVMVPGENPWLNELLGSRRAEEERARVGLLLVDWYRSVSTSGRLNDAGRTLMSELAKAEELP